MTRTLPSLPRLAGLAGLAALASSSLSCSEQTVTPPSQLNLDRPVDITFACHGGLRITNGATSDVSQPIEVTAMPTTACDTRSLPRDTKDPEPTPQGQEDLTMFGGAFVPAVSWYGFILQSGPGTVAISQFPTKPASAFGGADVSVSMLDANQLTPGQNSISVGEDPVAIITDRAGCHAVTANAGSCDLSVLDIPSAIESESAVRVERLEIVNGSGAPLRARAAAMVAEPASGLIGTSCPATPQGIVYVAYPSCHFVGAVATSTGTLVGGIRYDATGAPSILTAAEAATFTCPAECGGGGVITPGVRPVALDLLEDPRSSTRRLVIGADNSASFTVVELDLDSLPITVSQIALSDPDGDLGITSIALSPQIGMGGDGQVINDDGIGGQFQFVYAVATDGTVRVADVLDLNRECDTNVDSRFVRGIQVVRDLVCFPVDDPSTPPRRPGRGPGISVLGVPLSVAFIRSEGQTGDSRGDKKPDRLVGYFAMITTTTGAVFIVNVDDDNYPDIYNNTAPLAVAMPLAMPHQLRDNIGDRDEKIEDTMRTCEYSGPTTDGGPIGGPRSIGSPARVVPAGTLATEKSTQLPGLRHLTCDRNGTPESPKLTPIPETWFAAPAAVRDLVFPDLAGVAVDETWTFTWEGSLSNDRAGTAIDGPAIRESELRVSGLGLHVVDQTRPFCGAGVEQYDIVQFRGCDPTLGAVDCPSGYSCFVHPESQISGFGTCMHSNEADRLADACKDFLTTARRYTVKTVESGELVLMPRRVELRTTPLDGCSSDAQCEALGDYAASFGLSAPPSVEAGRANDPRIWSCVADPTRAPMGGTGKRCQMRCGGAPSAGTCSIGSVCTGAIEGQANSGFCMEGVIPSQSCVNAPQRYELRAGEAFAVVGTRSGFVHPNIEDPATRRCVPDPAASPLLRGRLPLEPKERFAPDTLHTCDPAADPLTGALPGGGFEPNPCSTTVTHTENKPRYTPGTCQLQGGDVVEREAPAVRFRNRGMALTFVDPYYPGDAMCITDRAANLGKIPHVVPGYTYSFRVTAGYSPKSLPLLATYPIKVVRGPTESIWVIDQGDYLSSSPTEASTRGKVFRVESDALNVVNVLR